MSRRESRQKPTHAGVTRSRGPVFQWVLAALVMLALLALIHPEAMFRGQIYASGDSRNADSFFLVGDAAREAGDYPLWNPYLFGGMPTFGSLAYVRFLYPPGDFFTYLQERLGFPPLTWMLAHILFGGLGMAFLLGRWKLPWSARLLAAAAWMLMPKVVAWSVYGHGTKLCAAMFLPWIVALTLDVLDGRGRRSIAVLGLLCGLQILRGHVQITYYTLITIGLLAASRWIAVLVHRRARPQPLPWRKTAALALALVLAFMIGSALLLPVKEYAGVSIRGRSESGGGADYQYATGWSLSPREMGTLVFPAAAGFGKGTYQGLMPFTDYPNYFGFLILALAMAAAATGRRELVASLAALGVLALMVSWGRFLPVLYEPLFRFLPYFNKFRIPSMALVLTGFAAAVLAAHGCAVLASEQGSRPSRRRDRLTLVLAAVGIVCLLGSLVGRGFYSSGLASLAAAAGKPHPAAAVTGVAWSMHAADLLRIGMVLVLAAAGIFLAPRRPAVHRALPWILLALLVVDLSAVDRRITHPEKSLRDLAAAPGGGARLVRSAKLLRPFVPPSLDQGRGPAFSALAAATGHQRVWPLGRLAGSNDFMAAGVRSLGGYHPAKLAAYEQIRSRLADPYRPAARLACWLGASVLAVESALPDEAIPVLASLGADVDAQPFHTDGMTLYRIRSALPRARLADSWLPASSDLAGFLERIRSGEEPAGAPVRLDRSPVPEPVAADAPLPAVEFLVDGGDEVVLAAEPTRPALLVLADMNVPGWRVEVDGEPAELLVADHVLRAVALTAGRHEVRFTFHDPALRVGLALTALGTLAVLLLLIPWSGARRQGSVTATEEAQ